MAGNWVVLTNFAPRFVGEPLSIDVSLILNVKASGCPAAPGSRHALVGVQGLQPSQPVEIAGQEIGLGLGQALHRPGELRVHHCSRP